MRRTTIRALLLSLLIGGCQKNFDERYADAQKKIREQAAAIDKDLADKASEAAMAPTSLASPGSSEPD
jgi:hypothetical protein